MALIAQATQSNFKQVPAGLFMALCYRVIDLGTQKTSWQGKEKWSRKVLLQWELHGEDDAGEPLVTDEGNPLSVSKRYTLSLGDNAQLRQDLKSWRGRDFTNEELAGFDISKLLGAACMVNVAHDTKDGNVYTNVASVTPVPKALKASVPELVNKALMFDVSEPDMEVFGQLSEKLQETIRACKEWQKVPVNTAASESANPSDPMEDMSDDIPW
jgi:hypothetical protein